MNKPLLVCLLSILLLASCKKETIPTTATASTETIGRVTVRNLEFSYLSARGQLKLEDKNGTTSSGYALRMQKDSVIWLSALPGLGIEAARMKLTQDSVYVLNRINREYLATDYNYLSNRFNVRMSFDILQAILVGNYQAAESEKVMDEAALQHVQQMRENLLFDFFIGRESGKLQQLNVQDRTTGNNIAVKYNDFQNVGEIPFAYVLQAQAQQQGQSSNFILTHTKVIVNNDPLEFPFSVPDGYKRITFN